MKYCWKFIPHPIDKIRVGYSKDHYAEDFIDFKIVNNLEEAYNWVLEVEGY
jgi:hypothetical protein